MLLVFELKSFFFCFEELEDGLAVEGSEWTENLFIILHRQLKCYLLLHGTHWVSSLKARKRAFGGVKNHEN